MGEEAQKSCFLSCGEGVAAPLCHSGADASHALGTQTTWNGGKGVRFGVGVLDRRPPLCNPLDGRLCHAISCFTHPRNEDNARFTELFWASKGSFQVLFARKLLRKLGDVNDNQAS